MGVITSGIQSPRAVVFACRFCAAIGADRAGREGLDLPAFFRLIPVDCAASVDPDMVLRALADGLDGVAVLGCHLGGCRHNEANRVCHERMNLLAELIDAVGLDRSRLCLSFGTAHEAAQFAALMHDFAAALSALPPLGGLLDAFDHTGGGPC